MIAIKPILPKPIKDKALRAVLLAGLREVGEGVIPDFNKTTATWEGAKPEFAAQISLAGGVSSLFVGPTATSGPAIDKWNWLNLGTKPHDIFPGIITGKSNKRALAFPGTFRAKTMPGVIGSTAGFKGGDTQVRMGVHHPGSEARKFDEVITRKWQRPFQQRMQEIMDRAAVESGHSI